MLTTRDLKKAAVYNKKAMLAGDFSDDMVAQLVYYWQGRHQIEDDGMCGPETQQSIELRLMEDDLWSFPAGSPEDDRQFVDGLWLPWDGPEERQPHNYMSAIAILGNPEAGRGSNNLDKIWYAANIIELHGRNALPGIPPKWYFKTHRMVKPYMWQGFRRASISAPDYEIKRAGGFNFRHIRHDPTKRLSTHALGAAVDVDPKRNFSKVFKRGTAPKAWSDEWMAIWPNGVTRRFVQAMESCGFAWGADWDEDGKTEDHTYLDPMHFEWIARDGNSIEV